MEFYTLFITFTDESNPHQSAIMKSINLPCKLTAVTLIMTSLFADAERIAFAYDGAGNRVLREIIIAQPANAHGRTTGTAPVFFDGVGEHTVKISNDFNGLITVSVSDLNDDEKLSLSLYSSSGVMIFHKQTTDNISCVDITEQSGGLYILVVQINGEETTWKIIKR